MESSHPTWQIFIGKGRKGKSYAAGEPIFREGTEIEHFYLLLEGQARLSKSMDISDPKAGSVLLWIAQPGEVLGLSSHFQGLESHPLTANASSKDCKVVSIRIECFQSILDGHAHYRSLIIRNLTKRLNFAELRAKGFTGLRSSFKLCSTLLFLTNELGIQRPQSTLPSPKSVHCFLKDLSELTGISSRYLRKLLSELEDSNLIQVLKDRIRILDWDGLNALQSQGGM